MATMETQVTEQELLARIEHLTGRREALRARFQTRDQKLAGEIEALRQRLPRKQRPAKQRVLDAHAQAGKHVETMEAAFRDREVATMSEAASVAGVPSGTSTWAVRALIEDGKIEPTGRVVRRSPEYRYLGGETTLGPGQ